MLKTIRRQMGLATLWVMAGLLAACTDDTFGGRTDRVAEGIPVTVRLGFRASEATPETRAAQGKEYEDRVDNVYILIFDEAGDIHDRFFLTDGKGLTYDDGDALKSSGKLVFNTTSLNNATIVGIANLAEGGTSTAYTVTEDELNAVTTLSGLQEKVMTMRDESVYRSACFMMTGYATTTVDENETYLVTIPALESGQTAELQCTLELERTDAKVKFEVKAESGNEKWTEFSFQPTGWSVKEKVRPLPTRRLPTITVTMMARKAEMSRKSRNITASRMPPTMHSRERWARTPTTAATISASSSGACWEPGPLLLKMIKLGATATSTSRAAIKAGKASPSAMDWR